MKRILLFFFLLCLAFSNTVNSQSPYPQSYFQSPIDFRILLSGTFGELRPNHFHTGIDIKTRGVEGASVFASADGYVSRVKISAFGTGKTVYMTHPNGFVTVYGHLSKLNDKIATYVKDQQYKNKAFEVDLYPDKDQFPYAKGDLIAFSGNSGSSAGAHCISKSETRKPRNLSIRFCLELK